MNFNNYQREAVNEVNGNVCVIATAGSGKTSVLVERMNHIVKDCNISTDDILAVTFSKKACENIIDRLVQCDTTLTNITVKTFHALAYNIIKDCYGSKYTMWTKPWEKEQILFDVCKDFNLCKDKDSLPIAQISLFINTQKINMLTPNNKLVEINDMPYPTKDMKKIYEIYESRKKECGFLEFEDLINKACDIFKKKKSNLRKWQNIYKYILVDEYQDISLNQHCLLKYLNSNNNLFVVGDSLQAIYSFRGGDCKYLLNFSKEWDNAKIINLPINYRCSTDIVETSNMLASFTPDSMNEYYKPAIANNQRDSKPIFKEFENMNGECDFIIQTIQDGVDNKNYSFSDYAILARTNAQLQRIQNKLSKKDIGFDIVGGLSFFELPEIKLFVSYLRLTDNLNDNSAFEYCFNKPNRWLNKAFLSETTQKASGGSLYIAMDDIGRRNWRFKNGINELQKIIGNLQHKIYPHVDKYIKYIRDKLKIDNFVLKGIDYNSETITEKIENIDTLEVMCKGFKTIKEFLSYVNENTQKINQTKNNNTIKLMTIHKSKGLEFPIVFVSGCADGLLPHSKSQNSDDEKRLFYVAITRAEKELYMTYSKNVNGKTYSESPFIDYIKDTIKSEK